MSRPSPSYSLTLRIEYPNQVGMLGRITSLIGERGGDIGAIDIVQSARGAMTRDITFAANDVQHGQQIIADVRALGEVDIVHVSDRTFLLHLGGKLEITAKNPIKTRDDVSMLYTPGVSRIVEKIVDNADDAWNLTIKKNTVAIVTDGSEVLGLGAAGPQAALPVMEAKAILLKEFAGVDAFPLPLNVQNDDEFVAAVVALSPTFGAIHLEDIAAPRCFGLEKLLADALDIPVFHNDQHGTAIVALAGLINALRVVKKQATNLKVVINGAEAAGVATAQLLRAHGISDIVLCNENGVLGVDEEDPTLQQLARETNPRKVSGSLADALVGADVLLGFGRRTVLEPSSIRAMNTDPIVFAMANPYPEVTRAPRKNRAESWRRAKAIFPIKSTICSPFPRNARLARCTRDRFNDEMKLAAARAIAEIVGIDELNEDYIIPSVFNRRVAPQLAARFKSGERFGFGSQNCAPSL
jgi:malate dehydrogenase (oxaloacetate-decarboxylating)